MYAAPKLFSQKVIHHTLALDPVLTGKQTRHNGYAEMAFARTVIAHMASVTGAIVHYFQCRRLQGLCQFISDTLLHPCGHAPL